MMNPRQPFRKRHLPCIWLMTDQRNDRFLEQSIQELPRRSGIVFRHYHLDMAERANRFAQIRRLARRYGHLISLADNPALARKWCADGVYGRIWKRRDTGNLLVSAPVHGPDEIQLAKHNGADLFFLSPIRKTRSHPGQKALGRAQSKRLRALCNGPVILLGGMDQKRFHHFRELSAHGWAAIDGLSKGI